MTNSATGAIDLAGLGDDAETVVVSEATDKEYQEFLAWKAHRAAVADTPVKEKLLGPVGVSDDYVVITADESPDMPPTGYPVGLNGTCYLIPPGKKVKVHKALLEIIQNAITSVPQIDPLSRRVTGYRDRPRIPWRYV